MDKQTVLQRMYDESAILRKEEEYSVERLTEAENRLERAADFAEEENMDLPNSLLRACRNAQSAEINSLSAKKLGVQPVP